MPIRREDGGSCGRGSLAVVTTVCAKRHWLQCTIFFEIGRNRDAKKSISACAKVVVMTGVVLEFVAFSRFR